VLLQHEVRRVAEKVFETAKSVPLTDEQKLRMAKARADIYLLQRKYEEGLEAAENLPDDQLTAIPDALGEKYYYIGFARKALHDEAGARAAFLKAKSATEEELKRTGDSEDTHIHLAKVLAYLGEKDSALAEAQRATELLPESKDALDGPVITTGVAQVYSILAITIARFKSCMDC
jgi:tetratricopeptide (TPR) repeat protein